MVQVTHGKVSYGRTIKTGDFESKRADVELAFSVEEGASMTSAGKAVAEIELLCIKRVFEILGQKDDERNINKAAKTLGAATEDENEEQREARSEVRKTLLPAKATKMPKAAAKADAADVVEEPLPAFLESEKEKLKPTAKAVDAAEVVEEEVEDDDLGDLLGTDEPKEITDKEVNEATARCQQENKNGVAIKKILAEFGVKAPARAIDMAQDKRAAYLEKLKTVKPLA